MKVNSITSNIFRKKLLNKNQVNTNKIGVTNVLENNFNNSFIPLSYNYLNRFSFKGNADLTSKENKMPIEIEEEKLTDSLIKPALEGKPLSSGVLLYSEDSKKSLDLFEKVAKKGNLRIVEFDSTQEDFCADLLKTLKNSRQNYIDNNQQTVILIKNSDLLLSDTKSNHVNVTLTKRWLGNCSEIPTAEGQDFYAATLVFETSKPQEISDNLLKNENLKEFINVPASGVKEIEKLIASFVNDKGYKNGLESIDDRKIKELALQLYPSTTNGGFSDSKIISILNKSLEKWFIEGDLEFNEIVSEKIKTTRRDISPRIIMNSLKTRTWLIEQNLINPMENLSIHKHLLENILSSCNSPEESNRPKSSLFSAYEENTNFIKKAKTGNIYNFRSAKIKGKSLCDFWLKISKENILNTDNERLKNIWFKNILNDPNKVKELTEKTCKILAQENNAIENINSAYCDILNNDKTITFNQKSILRQQKDNKEFFDIVSNNIDPKNIVQVEDKILTTLKMLSNENEKVLINAKENIFEPAKNATILSSNRQDDITMVEYIFQLISQAAKEGDLEEKNLIKNEIKGFYTAYENDDFELLSTKWQKLLVIAQKHFETEKIEELTNKNVTLLNSIAKEKENIQDKTILKLLDSPALSIEQKEFIARYAQDNNFKSMIKNQNVDIASTIEDLVYFEMNNKNVIEQTGLSFDDYEFSKMMSDKFKEINKKARDINIQGDKIASKLDIINETLGYQNNIISKFADSFEEYSNTSLSLQFAEFNELVKISQNTSEIRQYTQILTRTKLLELEKDRYYSEIVPELTMLLPEGEQIDIQKFLSNVDRLAKNEKDSIKRTKIIKAGAIVAGVVAAGAATYFFGPSVVAHLFSEVTNPATVLSSLSQASASTQMAKRLGGSAILFGASDGWPSEWRSIENQLKNFPSRDAYRAIEAVKEAKRSGGVSLNEIKKIIATFGFKVVNGNVVRR